MIEIDGQQVVDAYRARIAGLVGSAAETQAWDAAVNQVRADLLERHVANLEAAGE